jgi:hypothetical protein
MLASIMRKLAIMLAALVIAFGPPPVLAQNDKAGKASQSDNRGSSGKADKNEKSEPPGQSNKDARPEPPGQTKNSDKPEPPGQSNRDDRPSGGNDGSTTGSVPRRSDTPAPPSTGRSVTEELDEATQAVRSQEALPLARIVAVAESRSTGHVVNARLVRIDGVLLYQLTLLDVDGRSWREFYYARSGNPVVLP